MYQNFDDPWHQSEEQNNQYSYSRLISLLNIKRFGINSVVEFGCGLGYYTKMISDIGSVSVRGIDISETAISKAKTNFPHLDFAVDQVQNIDNYKDYDAVLFAEIVWYILDDINLIFEKMSKNMKGKYFLNNLVFYKGHQQYGREYFTSLKEFIDFVPFTLIGHSEATTVDSDTVETSSIFLIE
ncbi:MAG: methyltransferase domain-containing protein [Syntrophomonadaceae bacterium]|nr:methyltransferase domain-containing protein [Syntrophomonadaceae bacterium]